MLLKTKRDKFFNRLRTYNQITKAMTKEEFKNKLDELIQSEIAKANKPKPVFERPFKINYGMPRVAYVEDKNKLRVTEVFGRYSKSKEAQFICDALNAYEPE